MLLSPDIVDMVLNTLIYVALVIIVIIVIVFLLKFLLGVLFVIPTAVENPTSILFLTSDFYQFNH